MDEKFDKRELDSIFEEIKQRRKIPVNSEKNESDEDFEIIRPSAKPISDDTIQLKPVDLQRIREEKAREAKRIELAAREAEEKRRIAEQRRKETEKSESSDGITGGFKVNVRYFDDDEDEDEDFDLHTEFDEPSEGISGDFLANFIKIKKSDKPILSPKTEEKKTNTPISYTQSTISKQAVADEFAELQPFKVDFDEDPEIAYENEYAEELSALSVNGGEPKEDKPDGFELVNGRFGTLSVAADKIIREVYDWAETLFVPILIIIVTLTFFIRTSEVIGMSMQPTLYNGERLLVYQIDYKPAYGDIVVVQADHLPNELTGEMGESIVKRVIGLEGDQIYIEPETGTVYRNGKALNEPYIAEAIDAFHLGTQTYPLVVPKDCVFLLGDNRNNSTDSRWGYFEGAPYYVDCVEDEYVIGKCFFRLWPLDKIGVIE